MAIFTQRPRTSPEAVLNLARVYFGRLGLGMAQAQPDQLCFQDRHGYVHVSAKLRGRRTRLTVDSCGWEYWARCFLNHTD